MIILLSYQNRYQSAQDKWHSLKKCIHPFFTTIKHVTIFNINNNNKKTNSSCIAVVVVFYISFFSFFLRILISMQNYLIDSICIYWEHWSKDEMEEEEDDEKNRQNNWRWAVYMKRNGWKENETTTTAAAATTTSMKTVATMTTTTKKENNYQDATLTVDTTIKMRWASLIYLVHGTLSSCRSCNPISKQSCFQYFNA